ncbi:hypothetical protein pb186bvf_013260 [Paramecium bursaria]
MNQFFEDYEPSNNNKTIKVYRNGDSQLCCDLVIHDHTKLSDIKRQLQTKWDTHFQKLRLFNSEGVEQMDDDLDFLKTGSILFASKGEEFDQSFQLAEYEIIQEIGEGGFGKVVLGQHKQTHERVAIKMVKANMITNAQEVDMIFREARALKSLKHDHIVKIINAFFMANMQTVYIMEYLQGGELLGLVQEKGHFTEDEARHYFKQLASAIAYCHNKKIIHRDLKLENLLLTAKDSGQIRVIDFGISGFSNDFNPENADMGSLRYMAPELLKGQDKAVTNLVDVWSMGVILYGMLFGYLPFQGTTNKEVIQQIMEGQIQIPPAFKNKLSHECVDCLQRLLEQDPKLRITSHELINHPFLQNEGAFKIKLPQQVDSNDNSPDIEQKVKKQSVTFGKDGVKKPINGSSTPSVKKIQQPPIQQHSKTPTSQLTKQTSKFGKK